MEVMGEYITADTMVAATPAAAMVVAATEPEITSKTQANMFNEGAVILMVPL